MRRGARLVLSMFGAGYSPLAPGTVASAVAISFYAAILHAWSPGAGAATAAAMGLLFAAATVAFGGRAEELTGRKDPGWIVSDEAACALWAVLGLEGSWELLGVFAAFRLFDVVKPFGIRRLERLRGGWGILLDDLAAGALARGLVEVVRWSLVWGGR